MAQPNMAVTGIKMGYPRYAGNTEKQRQWYYHGRGQWREWSHKLNDLERQTWKREVRCLELSPNANTGIATALVGKAETWCGLTWPS